MGHFEWKLENGEWICTCDCSEVFRVPEREMNHAAQEKGGLERAKDWYVMQYADTLAAA